MTLALDPRRAVLLERLDSRVVGGVRFVDATTGSWVQGPLEVAATTPGTALLRNHSGVYVITAAPGLKDHITVFEAPPADPPIGDVPVTMTVRDLSGRYLARSVVVKLPRDPDPANAAQASSLFRPVLVPLHLAPAGTVLPGWAVLRVSVKRGSSEQGLPNAWLRLQGVPPPPPPGPPPAGPSPSPPLLATGMADARGEALVAVSGIPITNWDASGGGTVLATEIDAVLETFFDAGAGSPPNPDVIDGRRATLPTARKDVKLASGRERTVRLQVSIP